MYRFDTMPDYNEPKTPEDTPPPINPDVEPKTSAEMKAEDEREGEVLRARSKGDRSAAEKAMSAAQDGGADGKGEQALDSMRSETTLPPD